MKTAHKIRMNPTAEQVDYLKRACGTRRCIYNQGVANPLFASDVRIVNRTSLRSNTIPSGVRKAIPARTFVVGVDVGIKQAAVVSDGRRLENQRPFALHLKRLGKLQRKLSKKQKTKDPETKQTIFSKNYEKQRLKVARKHAQIATIRADIQHKFTTELARTCGVIGIEDLNIPGMMANRKLARSVADTAMGQLLQFLKIKVANAGGDLFIASRWFPSRHPLFVLWACQKAHAAETSDLSVSAVWPGHGPRSQCRLECVVVCNRTASPTSCVKLAVLGSGYDRRRKSALEPM